MFDNLDFDIDLSRGFEGKGNKRQSGRWHKDGHRIFIDELDLREDRLTKATFQIIGDFLEDFKLPKVGQQLRIRTQQQINLISIILKMVEVHKKIDELTIATYTLNKEAFAVLMDLLHGGKIQKLNLFLSSSYVFRDKEYCGYLKDQAVLLKKKFDFHLVFVWSHLKITLARCGQNFYQFEGSMNYSTNNMAEQLVFENRRDTYEYDHNFIHRTMTDRANKALEIIC